MPLFSSTAMSANFAWVSWYAGQRLVEDHPLAGVRDRRLQAVAGRAHRAEDDAEPGLVQAAERTGQATGLRQHGRRRQPYVVQHQLGRDRRAQRQLPGDLRRREARRRRRYDEAADAVVRPGPDHRDVGHRAVGDPHLRAVQHPVVAVAPGVRAHTGRVRAEVRLGQAEAADRLARGHPRQPLVLLLLAAVLPDRVHRQRPLHRHQRTHPGVGRLDLQAGEPVRDRTEAGAPVPGQVHPEEPERAQLLRQLPRRNARRTRTTPAATAAAARPRTAGRSPGRRPPPRSAASPRPQDPAKPS